LDNIDQLPSITCFLQTHPTQLFGVVHAVRVSENPGSSIFIIKSKLIIVKHISVAEKSSPSVNQSTQDNQN